MNDLATVLAKQGKYDQAKQLYRQALELRRKLLGDDHPHVGFTLSNLGEIHIIKQQFEEAERLLLRAYDILEQTVEEEHFARQNTLKRLVTMYEKWSRPDAANQWESLLVTAGASK
jgi:Flp pilus assembly protein TadD